jgi:hypothetical protein
MLSLSLRWISYEMSQLGVVNNGKNNSWVGVTLVEGFITRVK